MLRRLRKPATGYSSRLPLPSRASARRQALLAELLVQQHALLLENQRLRLASKR